MLGMSLHDLGLDEAWTAAFDDEARRSPFALVLARVGRVDRGRVTVHTDDGEHRALVRLPAGGTHEEQPTTGDWVGVEARGDGHVVRTVLPRRTAVVRKVAGQRSDAHVLAANLDTVLVAVPCEEQISLSRIERYVTVAWESGARPLVVLTKADLGYDPDGTAAEAAGAVPGVDVLVVSSETGEGVDALRTALAGGTTALLGQSGAGKSTLVNALVGDEVQLVAATRQDGKGRHTTTARELRLVPGGGVLVDTPGLREIGLHEVTEGLGRTFPDVEEIVTRCRFADCAHDSEPGCGVRAALESGELEERRWASWRKLQREAEWMAMRTDPVAQSAARKRWAATGAAGRARRRAKESGGPPDSRG